MTDRELLELAARAAGLEFDPTVQNQFGLLVVLEGFACQSYQKLWNPLTDDGDALRLAVKLELDVLHSVISVRAIHRDNDTGAAIRCRGNRPQMDPLAATRRSIVRAAAEIGKDKNT